MELSSIDEFMEMYVSGAKQITRRFKLLKTGSTIVHDIFYLKTGKIWKALSIDAGVSEETSFAYDRKHENIITIVSISSDTKQLISLGEYQYDSEGRISSERVYEQLWFQSEILRESKRRLIARRGTTPELITAIQLEDTSIKVQDEFPSNIFTYPSVVTHKYDENLHTKVIDKGYEDLKVITTFEMRESKCVKEVSMRGNKEFIFCSIFDFDNEGRISMEISLDVDGSEIGSTIYKYGAMGELLSERIRIDSQNIFWEHKHSFNDFGHVINTVSFLNGELHSIIDFTIDYYDGTQGTLSF
jgi:hypothetical protein